MPGNVLIGPEKQSVPSQLTALSGNVPRLQALHL